MVCIIFSILPCEFSRLNIGPGPATINWEYSWAKLVLTHAIVWRYKQKFNLMCVYVYCWYLQFSKTVCQVNKIVRIYLKTSVCAQVTVKGLIMFSFSSFFLSLVFGKSGIDRYSTYNDVQRFDVKIGLKLREI